MSKQFDVVVIGGGPGGYIAAIRAAQLGFQVACIDEWKNAAGGPAPGGTCTNVGCIPSKALLQSSEHFEHANKHFEEHGITAKDVKIDVAKMIARKDNVVKQNNDGILYLFKKNKVTFFHGRGSFAGKAEGGYEIKVAGKTEESIVGKQVIVATGSNARALPGVPFDEKNVLSNDGALRVGAVPKKLVLIGSGVIGLEMGSVWRRLGADVTILEGLPTFLGAVDEQIAKEAKKAFDKQGLKIELGVKVGEIKTGKKGVTVNYTNAKGEAVALDADKLIVSIGRVPNTNGLNVEAVGLQLDERGAIVVDGDCRTNVPGIWAVGDVVRGPMLAHKAEEEGVAVAENLAGKHGHVNYAVIPGVIYTDPEVACVGLSEADAKAKNIEVAIGKFQLAGNGRAIASDGTAGFVKVIACAKTDKLLGVQMVAKGASEMIAAACAHMEYGGSAEDVARTCFAHPTVSESFKEAAMAVSKSSIHSL